MVSPLFRSSAAILRRSNPRASTFPLPPGRSPVEGPRFLSAGTGVVKVEPTQGCYCNSHVLKELEKNGATLRELHDRLQALAEVERRNERHLRWEQNLACVLIPGTIAFYIFGPKKKEKPLELGI